MAGLEDLYREIILDHYKNPRNQGRLESPPAIVEQGFNPLCGDEVSVYLEINDGVLTDIKIDGHGCSISRSSASLMSSAVKGKTISEILAVVDTFKTMMSLHENNLGEQDESSTPVVDERSLGELIALQGVVKFPVRIKCATLPWNTLVQGLGDLARSAT
jgi:nitrogen fixation NifU-like protein